MNGVRVGVREVQPGLGQAPAAPRQQQDDHHHLHSPEANKTIPPSDRLFAQQLVDFLVSTAGGTTEALEALRQRLNFLFTELWNGGFAGSRSPVVTHYCRGGCPCGENQVKFQESLVVVLLVTLFSRCMPRPSLGKWVQLMEALRWLIGASVNNLFPCVFAEALKGCKFESPSGGAEEVVADSGIEAFALDVAWSAIAGKRAKENLTNLADSSWIARCIILGLLHEPIYILHGHFLDVSLQPLYAKCTGHPPILNLLNERHSILVGALQYWSSIVCDPSRV